MEVEFDLLKKCREAVYFDERKRAEQKLQEGVGTLVSKVVAISLVGGVPFVKGKVIEVGCPKQYLDYPISVRVLAEPCVGQTVWINPDKHIISISQGKEVDSNVG